jgi:hypothetical protein
MAGLAVSLALSVTQSLNWSVRMASDLESQMVSVERIKTYVYMLLCYCGIVLYAIYAIVLLRYCVICYICYCVIDVYMLLWYMLLWYMLLWYCGIALYAIVLYAIYV